MLASRQKAAEVQGKQIHDATNDARILRARAVSEPKARFFFSPSSSLIFLFKKKTKLLLLSVLLVVGERTSYPSPP